MINPYYSPGALDLEMISFDEPNLSYEYNTLCFWATKEGQIYSMVNSGCSCPTPFENYKGETLKDILPLLDRVGSLEQAESTFNYWGDSFMSYGDKNQLVNWFNAHFKF